MLLLRKYIVKELLLHFCAVISLLFLISSSNKFIGLLAKIASGKLPFSMVCKVMLLSSPEILALLMPLSLFIATLFVVSKLYADNEIIVLFASGLSWNFLITTTTIIAVLVATLTSILTLWVSPALIKQREEMLSSGQSIAIMNSVIPGQFQVVNDGKQVFYVGGIDDNNKISNVFIASNVQAQDGANLVITAKLGRIEAQDAQDGNFLILQHGHRYSGVVGNRNFSVIDFEEYGKQLFPTASAGSNLHGIQKTKEIWNSKVPDEKAEREWRLAMPISVIILSILAVSLAKVIPRQGRFAKFLPAILLYIIYCNAMLCMRRLIAINTINHLLGMWVVHLIFFVLATFLLLHSSGWLLYFRGKIFNARFN
jgi:lipopolysaccharide export system permease protein